MRSGLNARAVTLAFVFRITTKRPHTLKGVGLIFAPNRRREPATNGARMAAEATIVLRILTKRPYTLKGVDLARVGQSETARRRSHYSMDGG